MGRINPISGKNLNCNLVYFEYFIIHSGVEDAEKLKHKLVYFVHSKRYKTTSMQLLDCEIKTVY